ncbi:MAG: hypothetical protein RSE15_12060 [Flavobacterium sp.]|jgi:hypothetical protein|uniref:hypothetical protein n=1 Tax=Flavobacterium sp. TaxID=239 RepID=UPI002B48456F|nr:hypothetical protein [Flavobacterium sp.]WRH73080.1 MAG: hypothetical protein RSE15_12060 [Flavobacterium sp.]
MKNIFAFVFILINTLLVQAQQPANNNYNLPPGVVLNKKGVEKKDLSYKLNLENFNNNPLADNFLRKFSTDEIIQMENDKGEDYFYYKNANEYFMSLSNKVRKIFTHDELWYIYMFDQSLKHKLTNIK